MLKHLNGYNKAPELLINPTAHCLRISIIRRRITSLSKQMDLYNELLTAIWETRIVSYMWVSALSFLICDTVSTFPREFPTFDGHTTKAPPISVFQFEMVFPQSPISVHKVLDTFRTDASASIPLRLSQIQTSPKLTGFCDFRCHLFILFSVSMYDLPNDAGGSTILMTVINVILGMRLYALYQRQLKGTFPLLLDPLMDCFCADGFHCPSAPFGSRVPYKPRSSHNHRKLSRPGSQFELASSYPPVSSHLFLMMAAKVYQSIRQMRKGGIRLKFSPLLRALARDGTLYFLLHTSRRSTQLSPRDWTGTRLILNLREAAADARLPSSASSDDTFYISLSTTLANGSISGLAFLTCDTISTFPRESVHLQHRVADTETIGCRENSAKWSIPKVLYLFMRYWTLFELVVAALSNTALFRMEFRRLTAAYHFSLLQCPAVARVVIDIILGIRLYALYERSSIVLILLVLLVLGTSPNFRTSAITQINVQGKPAYILHVYYHETRLMVLQVQTYVSYTIGRSAVKSVFLAPPQVPLLGCLTRPDLRPALISWILTPTVSVNNEPPTVRSTSKTASGLTDLLPGWYILFSTVGVNQVCAIGRYGDEIYHSIVVTLVAGGLDALLVTGPYVSLYMPWNAAAFAITGTRLILHLREAAVADGSSIGTEDPLFRTLEPSLAFVDDPPIP
ncbi:hypothetical protein CVT26_006498 [Gymnopilus dilepis]|uniref:DUF6533 domain-containing protein n=1 Tax=Gymnopilus dilepis TaxID=231916 RepID=A0A409W187_9AGAR|nr:hypothetical protein CVT26_006498 [Gymnopilus dilepis]